MYEALKIQDRNLTVLLHGLIPHNAFFDWFFSILSLQGASVVIWAIILVLLAVFEGKKHKAFIPTLLTSVGGAFVLTEFVLKNIFDRTRPTTLYTTFLTSCPLTPSFPSSHAAVSFAAAVVFSSFDKKRRNIYYIIAFLISLSRIYLGCHYVIDVTVGAFIGIFVAKIALRIFLRKRK